MIALLQRVSRADVVAEGVHAGSIDRGLLVMVGVVASDTAVNAKRLSERILGYRIFADGNGRMNLSVRDSGGGVLLVPQFTLAADTRQGMRPSFTPAAPPEIARELFQQLVTVIRTGHTPVATGVFGADMQVTLTNDGPVTIWLEA
jgi:D-tyrosyl-tRNA(Tyr) deacylase